MVLFYITKVATCSERKNTLWGSNLEVNRRTDENMLSLNIYEGDARLGTFYDTFQKRDNVFIYKRKVSYGTIRAIVICKVS